MAEAGPSNAVIDVEEMDAAREQRMLAKLPQKEGSELKKEEIQFIMRVEKALSKNFLFAVNRKQAGSTQFVRLHYNIRGDKNSAISSAPCKYIRCQDCGDLLYHEGSQLSKHVKSHERQGTKRKADTPIEEFIPSPLTPEEKNAVTNVLARYAIKGGVSFRSLTMPAFTEAAIALMNIGAKRKKQVNETQLVDRTTIARRVGAIAESSYEKIKDIVGILQETGGAIAADYGKRLEDYLCVTGHFIEPSATEWKLRCVPIGFSACAESKTSPQVWLDITEALEPFGMAEEDIQRCIGVSDQGRNIAKAMAENMRSSVSCACHVVNTVANRSFDLYVFVTGNNLLTPGEQALIARGTQVLDYTRLVANEVRSVPKVLHELTVRPNKGVDTRWLSSAETAKDVEKILNELVELKSDREFQSRMGPSLIGAITKLNGLRNELADCIQFLAIFEMPILRLQDENQPTIHLVWSETVRLLNKAKKFEEGPNNSTLLRALGKSCRIALEHKLNEGFITEAHKIASFLDPRMRHMGHLSDDDREQLYNVVRSRIAGFPLTQRAPAQLSQRMEDSDSDDEGILMRRVDTPRNADEVTSYVEDHFNETASAVFNPLTFWHTYEDRYPKLSKLALRYLAVPASSASCERAFRRMKTLITESRESLSPETVTKLMLSKSMLDGSD